MEMLLKWMILCYVWIDDKKKQSVNLFDTNTITPSYIVHIRRQFCDFKYFQSTRDWIHHFKPVDTEGNRLSSVSLAPKPDLCSLKCLTVHNHLVPPCWAAETDSLYLVFFRMLKDLLASLFLLVSLLLAFHDKWSFKNVKLVSFLPDFNLFIVQSKKL